MRGGEGKKRVEKTVVQREKGCFKKKNSKRNRGGRGKNVSQEADGLF